MSKRIPISFEEPKNSDNTSPTSLTPPTKTLYQEISARVHVEAIDTFTNERKVLRYKYDNEFIDGDDAHVIGMLLGDTDVIELDNLEQINAFKFITNENTKIVRCNVQYYHEVQ